MNKFVHHIGIMMRQVAGIQAFWKVSALTQLPDGDACFVIDDHDGNAVRIDIKRVTSKVHVAPETIGQVDPEYPPFRLN